MKDSTPHGSTSVWIVISHDLNFRTKQTTTAFRSISQAVDGENHDWEVGGCRSWIHQFEPTRSLGGMEWPPRHKNQCVLDGALNIAPTIRP